MSRFRLDVRRASCGSARDCGLLDLAYQGTSLRSKDA